MAKGVGFTIHAGWFPQLLKGNPAKKFSTSKSNRGISVKGYNREFVKQIQTLSEERKAMLTDPTLRVSTNLQVAARAGEISATTAFMQFVMSNKQRERAVGWRDLWEDASDYKKRSKSMAIRGNHIWYQLGKTGPKEMANTLLDRQNFKFESAESWYEKEVGKGGAQAHQEWASKILGLDPSNVNQNISVQEVEVIGDVSEETVIKEEGLQSRDKGIAKELGMQKPAKPEGGARGRDVSSKAFGEIESTDCLLYTSPSPRDRG